MPHRICVQPTIPDARGEAKKNYFNSLGIKSKVDAVRLVDCYTIDLHLSAAQIKKACTLLANPIMEQASETQISSTPFNYAIEIGFLPGVTDNVATTTTETLQDGLKLNFKPGQNVYSSQVLFISGKLLEKDVQTITSSLYNPLIQRANIKTFSEFKKSGGMDLVVPKVKLEGSQKVFEVNLQIEDEELAKIGKQGIMDPETKIRRGPLSMDLDYLKTIRAYFNALKRKPTDIELESLAQTWSEHCKHTIFADPIDDIEKGLYKTYIKEATKIIRKKKNKKDFCVSVFTDNSGAIVFDNDYLITHKVETHNTPSALDPFGGSITGIVGVNRDSLGFGLGAKPVINTYGFCLADPADKTELYRDEQLTNKMLSASRIMEGVVAGINAGGNQSGIPTNSGFVYFNPRYRGKPLVFAGTVGLIPKKTADKLSYKKQAKPGDYIVMVGGRVGQDGIHGATFSSETLDSHSPATAVQIGDPITQKKFSDTMTKEARDLGLYNSITDNGAGGLSSSVGEMAKESGGCEVNLEKVPLKYAGLQPWQIWISESQERMTLAVPKAKWKQFKNLMQKRGVEASIIGTFTKSKKCIVTYQGKKIMDIAMDFLHDGRPIKHLQTRKLENLPPAQPVIPSAKNFTSDAEKLLSRLNVGSFEFITNQYDHEVQAGSVLKPIQGKGRVNAEATVTRPVLSSQKGVVLSYGLNPSYSELDPYRSASCAIDSAIRTAVAAGANVDQLALLDNFCWCSSNEPERLWQLKQSAKACFDFAVLFGTPFISGKDSMFNDFKGYTAEGKPIKISIPPTLLISAIGVVPDSGKTVSIDAKDIGDSLYILGETHAELGGSEYFEMTGVSRGTVPAVSGKKNRELYRKLYKAVQKELVSSAISVGRGGLSSALSKSITAGGLGTDADISKLPGTAKETYEKLFSESQGRILVTISPKREKEFKKTMGKVAMARIGKVTQDTIRVIDKNREVVMLKTTRALQAYKKTLKKY